MGFLQTVISSKQKQVKELKKILAENRFAKLFKDPKHKPIFIAEIKPKSPSAGDLIHGDPMKLLSAYQKGGADAISVLTDSEFFGGSCKLFRNIRRKTNLPLFRKEFIIDETQIFESVRLQADAVLLIVQLVSVGKLKQLIDLSNQAGIVPLVEVINEAELEIALNLGARFIGVNSRNLQTMEIDQDKALAVLKKIPESIHKLIFSGIENEKQVQTAIEAGADGLLIGTSLLKAKNPKQKLAQLRQESQRIR